MPCGKNFYNTCPPGRGPTGPTGPTGVGFESTGRVLTVDQIYGDDVSGASAKYTYPFLTINAALSNVVAGETIFVRPGTYNETVQMVSGTALRGQNSQTVTIQQSNATVFTTLLTMSTNCRVEDVTFTLSSASNVSLIGVSYPSGTAQNAKLRTAVVNVNSSSSNDANVHIYGVLSGGTSSTAKSSVDAIRATTINVSASTAGNTFGLLVNNSNRFSIRDTNVYARGSGANIVGVTTTNADAIVDLRSSTIFGSNTTVAHDIYREFGRIILTGTDLVNLDANQKSFEVTEEAASLAFGVVGNITNAVHYLIPGTVTHNDLPTAFYPVKFPQKVIVFRGVLEAGLNTTGSATVFCRKNISTATPFYEATISTSAAVILSNSSETFDISDTLYVSLSTSNIGNKNPVIFNLNVF